MLRKFFAINALLMGLAAVPLQAAEAAGAEPKGELLDLNVVGALWVLVIFIVLAIFLYKTAWKNVLAGLKARRSASAMTLPRRRASASRPSRRSRITTPNWRPPPRRPARFLPRRLPTASGWRLRSARMPSRRPRRARSGHCVTSKPPGSQAVADIYQQAAQLATSVAEKILRRNLNPDDQRDLVNQSIEQFAKVGKN